MTLVTNYWGWTPRGIWRWLRWGWAWPVSTWDVVLHRDDFRGLEIAERRCKLGPLCFSLGVRLTRYRGVNG